MRIVQINAIYKFLSTGRTTMEMHEYCMQHGVESYVFCPNISDEANNIYQISSNIDRQLHAVGSRVFGIQAFFSRHSTRKMLKKIDKMKPDVVILRNLHGNYINVPMLLKYLANNDIATIVVMHDCWFFTGHCTHYFSNGCDKWQTECEKCPLIKADNKSWFFDTSNFMFRKKKELFDAISRLGVIGVSDWITNEAKKSVILSNAKVFKRVYNWIDLDKFYPRDTSRLKEKLGINDEFIVLGVAASWDNHKGLSHFVTLAKGAPDIIVILLGNLNERIPDLCNLISVGRTANVNELAEYYSLADTLLVCSSQETFGKVAAEALACGTPIISNDRTANPEIAGRECGFVTHNNDDTQILLAIKKIREYGKASYSKKCIERAKNNFLSSNQIEAYLNVARELMAMKK